jgi:hypothetical protein
MAQPITLIAHIWNESFFLPYFIRHYLPIVDRALIFDYDSVDGSRDVIKQMAPDWKVRPSKNRLFGAGILQPEITAAEMEFDGWKLVMNVTEYLIHEDLRGLLHSLGDEPAAFWATDMVMVDHPQHVPLPVTDAPLFTQRWHGFHTADNFRGRMIHNHEHGQFEDGGRHKSGLADKSLPRHDLFVAWFLWSPLRRTWHRRLAIDTMLIAEERYPGGAPAATGVDVKLGYRRFVARSHDLWSAYPSYRATIERMVGYRLPDHELAPNGASALERFDEQFYLAANPDVAEAIAAGYWGSGLSHFENCGFHEGRAPCAT